MDENSEMNEVDEGVASDGNVWTPQSRPSGFINLKNPEEIDNLPDELQGLLDIGKSKYKVVLQKYTNDDYQGRPFILGTWFEKIPEFDEVVKQHGTGNYRFVFQVISKKLNKGAPNKIPYDFQLYGEHYERMYEDAKREREKERYERLKQDKQVSDIMGPAQTYDPARALEVTLGAIKPLIEMSKAQLPVVTEKKPFFTPEIVTAISGAVVGFITLMQKSQETQMNLLLGIMGSNKKTDLEENSMERMFKMIERMNGIQSMLTPKEESMTEKIVEAISNNLPVIMGMLQIPQPARDMAMKPFENSPEVQTLKNNRAVLNAVVNTLDEKLGPKLTDDLLDGVLKVSRPNQSTAPAPSAPEN